MRRIRSNRGIVSCIAAAIASAASAQTIISYRTATWSETGGAPHMFAVVQVDRAWNQRDASALAARLAARLAVLPSRSAIDQAVALTAEPAFWQCAGPWVGSSRLPDAAWIWNDGVPIHDSLWSPGRPAQPVGLSACAMLAGESAPSGGLFDALDSDLDAATTSSALLEWLEMIDCDADGLPDPLQIAMQPDLDGDFDGLLDACMRTADLDGNGTVDNADIALALLDFGECAGCASDQDGNGVVDYGDIALILLNFGSV